MSFKDPLHGGQVELLRWVADGCSEGKWQGHSYKTTANALAGRRLIKVSKKGGGWTAELLPAGEHYLAHNDYPPDHWKIRRNAGTSARPPNVEVTSPISPTAPTSRPKPRRAQPPATSGEPKPTRKLVDDVLAAGGILIRELDDDAPSYSHLVGIVNGRKLVPDDDRLLLSNLGSRRVEIRLASASDWTTQKPREIADPGYRRKHHPAVAELRAERALADITPATVRARAFRLLNALALEATARGIGVSAVEMNSRGYRQAFDGYHGYLLFQFDHVTCVVSILQITDQVPHEPTRTEIERQRRGHAYIPTHDQVKTERLSISANDDGRSSRREKWSDTKTLALEYHLHDVLARLVGRNESEKARIERERLDAIARRKREELAAARATEAYYEQRRADAFLADFATFTRRNDLAAFLTVMEEHAAGLEGDARAAADEWIGWCRVYVESLDPFARPLAMPETKPPGYSDLSEFKKRLGYHGYF